MDKELLSFLLGGDNYKVYKDERIDEILKKLDEINLKLQALTQNKKSLCEQILQKTYVIISSSEIDSKLNPSLYILNLDGDKVLVTFKDTMELLQLYFKLYKDDVENKLPRRLMPLFSFLKKNGLIYLDHEEMTYKLV